MSFQVYGMKQTSQLCKGQVIKLCIVLLLGKQSQDEDFLVHSLPLSQLEKVIWKTHMKQQTMRWLQKPSPHGHPLTPTPCIVPLKRRYMTKISWMGPKSEQKAVKTQVTKYWTRNIINPHQNLLFSNNGIYYVYPNLYLYALLLNNAYTPIYICTVHCIYIFILIFIQTIPRVIQDLMQPSLPLPSTTLLHHSKLFRYFSNSLHTSPRSKFIFISGKYTFFWKDTAATFLKPSETFLNWLSFQKIVHRCCKANIPSSSVSWYLMNHSRASTGRVCCL